jgi:membrane-associated protease RseP (regulator of RpoE activity)
MTRTRFARTLLCFGLLSPALAVAVEPDPRVAAEIESALIRLHELGAFDSAGGALLELERPARTRYELGAVVDITPQQGGLPVLAITPGGAAEQLGLQVGDRLLQVNGYALASAADAASGFMAAVESAGGQLALRVARGDRVLQMNGQAQPTDVPGYRLQVTAPAGGCGRIDMSLRPPVSQGLFPVVLHEVGGALPGPLDSHTFRLRPGRNTLKLSEAIDSQQFTFHQNRKRERLFRHERFKTLEIDVEPNAVYRIGARLIRENIEDIPGGTYWEPVIWAVASIPCR